MLHQIAAPHFVAGVETRDGIVILAAPIVKWTMGRRLDDLADYFSRKGWTCEPAPSDFML